MQLTEKLLTSEEIDRLEECMQGLGAWHTEKAVFPGIVYPSLGMEMTLAPIRENVAKGTSLVKVYEEDGRIVAFAEISMERERHYGTLDFLYVEAAKRGTGLGEALMEWSMKELENAGCDLIDIHVVDGNPSLHFYEKFGFKPRMTVMSRLRTKE